MWFVKFGVRWAHQTPNFTNPDFFVYLIFGYFFEIEVFNWYVSKYTQTCQYSLLILNETTLQHLKLGKLKFGIRKIWCSMSSSNTQFYKSWIFYLFTFWVFFPDESFKLISKYTLKCQYNSLYKKKKKTLCSTLNWGNWNSGFGKLDVRWAERDTNLIITIKKVFVNFEIVKPIIT